MSKRPILHRYSCPGCTATAYPNEELDHDSDCMEEGL